MGPVGGAGHEDFAPPELFHKSTCQGKLSQLAVMYGVARKYVREKGTRIKAYLVTSHLYRNG